MPKWIIVEDGDVFEGYQGHWADCFFSNALMNILESFLIKEGYKFIIRDMTNEELEKYPEILEVHKWLIKEYGSI